MLRKRLTSAAFVAVAVFVLIQLVPYGRNHTNPPVRAEPTWSAPDIRALAVRACYDCHSNETRWPWYSHMAPVSWLVQRDVEEGRRALNYSEWTRPQPEAAESAEETAEGEMPPAAYLLIHPEARLSAADRDRFVQGLKATFGGDDGREGGAADD